MKLRKKQKPEYEPRRKVPGTPSPAVFSYYARGGSANDQNTGRHESDQKKPSRRHFAWASLPSYAALVIIAGAVLYACTLQANPKIIVTDKPGTIYRPMAEYQKAIAVIWQRSVFNRTKLTVHSADIQRDVTTQFNELSSVKIELPLLGRRPTVTLVPSRPAMEFISSNGAFYIDVHGKVLSRTTDVTQNNVSLPVVTDETGIQAELGKAVIPESEASFLEKLFLQMAADNISVESIILPAKAANEADVRVKGQGYYLKFSTLTDPRQAVGNYLAVTEKFATERIKPAEYIDLRVEEKVFYK